MDGFYAAYLTGRAGNTIVLFAIRGEIFIGVDGGGLKYDGQVEATERGLKCTIVYVIPAQAANLITGASPPATEQRVPLEFVLPKDFWNGQVIGITTPMGPVNAKFQKLRDW
ncbi:hypothetical protein AS156_30330 [Bradyrhizobium macuxiense]|uniref:Uncharacterized protein n=1 Tax=Bradyrhizobium macuxiense TaxID=1755647 RepID=A0A120FRA6_9BRAD|nr:hypothetical protein [Bradyrhizobium macuxiense]KWV59824.1 hypothetical protein AS156_30330 [Bradyrhizobium macuxiense]